MDTPWYQSLDAQRQLLANRLTKLLGDGGLSPGFTSRLVDYVCSIASAKEYKQLRHTTERCNQYLHEFDTKYLAYTRRLQTGKGQTRINARNGIANFNKNWRQGGKSWKGVRGVTDPHSASRTINECERQLANSDKAEALLAEEIASIATIFSQTMAGKVRDATEDAKKGRLIPHVSADERTALMADLTLCKKVRSALKKQYIMKHDPRTVRERLWDDSSFIVILRSPSVLELESIDYNEPVRVDHVVKKVTMAEIKRLKAKGFAGHAIDLIDLQIKHLRFRKDRHSSRQSTFTTHSTRSATFGRARNSPVPRGRDHTLPRAEWHRRTGTT